MRKIVGLVVVVLVAALGTTPVVDAGTFKPHVPRFVATKCPAFFPPDRDVDCGYVVVPEDRNRPHDRKIHVMVAVMHASSDQPAGDPIMMVDGGPSFGAIAPFAVEEYFGGAAFAEDHDVILVDTRGTGMSRPRLGCRELDRADVKAFYAPPTLYAKALPIFTRALSACWQRLVGNGVDPSDYTTAESVADLDAIRKALGIDRFNLFALSADGVLGATYVRLFPGHLRSVVFDSTMGPEAVWLPDVERGRDRLMNKVFRGCRHNAACHAKYPGIKRLFHQGIRKFHNHPVRIRIPAFQPHPVTVEIDGTGFYYDAVNSIYPGDAFTPSFIHDPLEYIWRAMHGELKQIYREWFGTGPVTNEHLNDFLAQGKTMSYICHDMVNLISRADLREAARDLPAMAPLYLHPDYELALGFSVPVSPAGCAHWSVGRAPGWQHTRVHGTVPALALAGEYDMSIPPALVRSTVRGMSNVHFFKFPASAHLQLASYTNGSECAREITAAFLKHPRRTPDASCLDDLPRIDFTPPGPDRHRGHGRWLAPDRRPGAW